MFAPDTSFVRTFLRRWYFWLVGFVITAGLCAAAIILVPPTYTASTDVLVAPPPATSTGPTAGLNPYIGISGYTSFADVVARTLMGASAVEKLKAAGLNGTYTVTRDLT